MRKLLGWAVLILGTGLLGYYATNNHAQRMEQAISGAAAQAVTSSVHGVTTRVSGRDIIVEGIANDAAEHDQIVAALDAVDGRRVVDDRLTILERAAPFVLTAERAGDAASYSGNVPTEAVRATLAERIGESGANALDLAAGMPDDAWPGAALQGLDALDLLESGKMVLSDRSLTLTGQAYSPVERDEAKAALEGLADGYSVQTDITTRIPLAAPYLMQAVKDAGTTRHSGNVPDAQTRANFAATMGADADTLELAIGMPDSDWPGVVTQALGALDQLEAGELRVDDRMITLTGVARSPLEQAAAEAALAGLPEGYTARTDITARIPLAQPYVLDSVKTAEGQTFAGNVPDDASRAALAETIGDAAAGLELAVGMPDGAWPDVARTGLTALQGLERGEMHLRDRALTVTGAAVTPHAKTMAEAALADLPEGYTSDVQITTLDDGQPVAYTVTYSREGGANVSGKLPHGADAASIAAALGVDAVSGEARSAGIGAPDAANGLHATLSALAGQIDDIDTLSIEQGLTGKVVHATLRPGADGEGLRAALGSILGDAAELQVVSPAAPAVEPAPEPAPEAATEPAPAPEPAPAEVATEAAPASLPDIPTCLARAKAVQAEAKINFLTASADLDPASTAVVDALAEVITGCLANPDLRVEVGGHTDSDGSDTANYILSKERAQAVLDALVARGVPAGRIIAVGFGETEPIADNSTAEGKAANRRTAIRWFGLGQ